MTKIKKNRYENKLMSEKIITESGEIKIEEQQPTPEPVKVHLALALRQLIYNIDAAETSTLENQNKLDRICSQLTDEQWAVLAITQIKIIATRNVSAADYLDRLKATE